MCKHITVILRNSPGEFSRLAERLTEAKVNILAFHVATTGPSSGYAQLACDAHLRALAVLTGAFHSYAYESEVVAVRAPNEPGSLHRILADLATERVNVENAYQTLDAQGRAIVIVEPTPRDIDTARAALSRSRLQVLADLSSISS